MSDPPKLGRPNGLHSRQPLTSRCDSSSSSRRIRALSGCASAPGSLPGSHGLLGDFLQVAIEPRFS
jgi:hypothetical protein